MFARLLWKLVRGSRGRLAVALIALTSSAAVSSALLNLDLDIERKLTREFRTLGANVVIAPRQAAEPEEPGAALAASPILMDSDVVLSEVERRRTSDVIAAAPYLYLVARASDTAVVVAGTWLDQASKLEPTWRLDGDWITSRADESRCLVGRSVARQFHLAPRGSVELTYLGRTTRLS